MTAKFATTNYASLPLIINSMSGRWSTVAGLVLLGGSGQVLSSTAWPSSNLAIYIPFKIPFDYPIARVFWCNGGTVTGNADFGIYDLAGNKLFSTGLTAQAGATAPQYVNVPFLLRAGGYYMGLSLSNTSTMCATSAPVNLQRMLGLLQQGSASPLPSTMTSTNVGQAYWPQCGFTRMTSGF